MLLLLDRPQGGKLSVTGPDRVRFLNGMTTNDVARLEPGRGLRAAVLTVKGRVVADPLVLCDEDALHLVLLPELGPKLHAVLERHAIVDDVAILDRGAELADLGVYGEGAPGDPATDEARAALATVLGEPIPDLPPWGHLRRGALRLVRAGELGLSGYRLIGPPAEVSALAAGLAAAGARWLSPEEAELRRVEAGEPRYGADVTEDHLPIEARLDDAISHTKGCYLGQEVIARATARGHINKRLSGLRLDGERPAERGARLRGGGREEAGTVTSSVRSLRFGVIALAYVHRSVWTPGTEVEVVESGGPRRAWVAELPFAG